MQSVTQSGQSGKLELLTGQPVTMRLVYSAPQEGEGRYGKWYRYSVEVDGERLSWFPPHAVVEALNQRGVTNGDMLTIERFEVIRNGKRKGAYTCELNGLRFEVGNSNGNGQDKPTPAQVKADTDALYGDRHYHQMSHGYGLTKDDVQPSSPTTDVHIELSSGVFKVTLQELSEIYDWLMVNGVTMR